MESWSTCLFWAWAHTTGCSTWHQEMARKCKQKYPNMQWTRSLQRSVKFFFHFKPRPDSSGYPAWRASGAAIRSDLVGRESVQQIQRRYDVSAGYQPHILLAVSLAMMLNFALPKFSSGFLTFWWFFVVLKTYSSCLTLLDTWRQNLRRTAWELTWSLQQCSFCSFLL